MPYIMIFTNDIVNGPAIVLDGRNDYELTQYLSQLYGSVDGGKTIQGHPVNVLNGAEQKGYKLISTVVNGGSIIWMLHK